MAAEKARCVWSLSLFVSLIHFARAQNSFSIPDVRFEVFKPKGFRASIPDVPNLSLFVFQGNVNRDINNNAVGALKGEVTKPTGGRWVYENTDVELKVADVISYYIFVSVNRVGYMKDNQRYVVGGLVDRFNPDDGNDPSATPANCPSTVTKVRGGRACAGQTIFEDDFSSLKEDLWQIEQFLPMSHPEYPFVSYQRLASDPTVSVTGGALHISPKLQQTLPGFNNESIFLGSLDLFNGCTSRAEECYRQASGSDILPPVVSGRVTSTSFAFKYGTVIIRAKLPQGDWLYPEILLEPFLKKYGSSNYASGVLKIASARGNKDLRAGLDEYGNKVLDGGPIMDFQCRQQLLGSKILRDGRYWGDDFHEYSVTWTPQYIALSVDGEEWARASATGQPLREQLPPHCAPPKALLSRGTPLAPFDDYFYLTFGVAAGGITEFRDDAYSGGRAKPWRNAGRKGMLHFWEALGTWHDTWTSPGLVVDHVRVVAL